MKNLQPPYYAVMFSSQRTDGDRGYEMMADRMVKLAANQPGFLAVESVRNENGFGITVSYWASKRASANWKAHAEHAVAQETGKQLWYSDYTVRVAKVEREYGKAKSECSHRETQSRGATI